MRTKTLDEMVSMLRAECGESTNASMGINAVEGLYQIIRRTQEELYDQFNWPQFIVDTDEDILVGQHEYTLNDAIDDMRIFDVWIKDSGSWVDMSYGITPIDYNTSDSENGGSENVPSKWQLYPDRQFEVWPKPAVAGTMRFRHTMTLPALSQGSSVGTLDANLIVLFAAAERMADKKMQSAPLKLKRAEQRLASLKSMSSKNKVFSSCAPAPTGRTLPQHWTVRVPR